MRDLILMPCERRVRVKYKSLFTKTMKICKKEVCDFQAPVLPSDSKELAEY